MKWSTTRPVRSSGREISSSLRSDTRAVGAVVPDVRARRMLPLALMNWRRILGVRLGPRPAAPLAWVSLGRGGLACLLTWSGRR